MALLSCFAKFYNDDKTARIFDIAVRTVEVHRAHIMRKLNVHSRTELIESAQLLGFAGVSPKWNERTHIVE
jgi:DNA-binding CsgD family transcriptional regulator